MARLLDKILVIDVKATCWEGMPSKGEVSEIIEIGLCVDDAWNIARILCLLLKQMRKNYQRS